MNEINKTKPRPRITICLILLLVSGVFTYGQSEKLTLMVETGHRDWVESVVFSPDGRFLASGAYSSDSMVKLWDIETGQELASFDEAASTLTFSPDSKTLAVGGNTNGEVRLWNLKDGRQLKAFGENLPKIIEDSSNAVWSLAFSSDGKIIASVTRDQVIRLWDVASGRVLKEFSKSNEDISSIVFSNNDKNILSTSLENISKIWSVRTGQMLKQLDVCNRGERTMLSADGKLLASIDAENIKICDIAANRELKIIPLGEDFVGETAVFSHNGRMIAASGAEGVNIWSTITGKKLKLLKGQIHVPVSLAFSPTDNKLASGSENTKISVWNIKTAEEIKVLEGRSRAILAPAFSKDGKILAISEYDQIRLWNLEYGQQVKRFHVSHRHEDGWLSFSPDGKTIATSSHERQIIDLFNVETGQIEHSVDSNNAPDWIKPNNGRAVAVVNGKTVRAQVDTGLMQLVDVSSNKELASLIGLDEDAWIVASSDGRFDTNKSLNRVEGLHWILNGEILKPLSLDIFMRQYYEPKLLQRLLNCNGDNICDQEFKPLSSIAVINRTQPKIKITRIASTAVPNMIEVTLETENAVSEYQKDKQGRQLSSSVYDVRLFRDGQLVGHSTSDKNLQTTFRTYKDLTEELTVWRQANKVDLANGKKTFIFKVKLPNDSNNKQIEFSAYAFNGDRVKSETVRASYKLPANFNSKPAPRKAYVIAFGVNKYENAEWNLQFAGNDARAMLEIVSPKLRERKELSEVVELLLISDDETANGQTIEKRDAIKANVKTILDLLSGKNVSDACLEKLKKAVTAATLEKIKPADPDDLVLISFSSHGYADRNGTFYILPGDIGKDGVKTVTNELLQRSISSDELSLWLRDVDAGEMVMIVDACHAASAVEGKDFKPAPMGSRGLGQLAFDKGMKILTATQAANVAIESGGSIGHGLLTYALLREGIEKGEADFRAEDKTIYLKEWLEFGEFSVPGLYEMVAKQQLKAIGKDIGKVDWSGKSKNQIYLQTPTLFDFTRKKQEMILMHIQP